LAKEHLHHTAANLVLQAVVAEGNMLEPATKIQLVIHGVSLMLTSKKKHPSRRKSYKMKLILEGHEESRAECTTIYPSGANSGSDRSDSQ